MSLFGSKLAAALGLLCPTLTAAVRYCNPSRGSTYSEAENLVHLFPDVDIDLFSPIFSMPETVPAGYSNGTAGPTPQAVMERFFKDIADRNSWATYNEPDFTSEDGRAIPYIILSTNATHSPVRPRCDKSGKVRIYLQGGAHGNEPMGDQSIMALVGQMDARPEWALEILEKVDILAVPRYNPDGVHCYQRSLITNLDPNRDHAKMASQQTRDIKRLMARWSPHVGVDLHELTPFSYGPDRRYLNAEDVFFSAMKNLNIQQDIRRLSEGLFTNSIASALEARGLRSGPFATGGGGGGDSISLLELTGEPRFGDVSVGLTQCVMFLAELRASSGVAGPHVQRRLAAGLTFLEALIQTAADNADEVISTIEAGRRKFIHSNDDIIISDAPTQTSRNYTFIDTVSGELIQVPVLFQNTTLSVPVLTRHRPEGYLIPPGWSAVASRLRDSGVELAVLDEPFHGEVEALFIDTVTISTRATEGIVQATLTSNARNLTIDLPAGTFWASTRQKNAAHLFGVLEPEGSDSYPKNWIIPQARGDEYPVYRVMTLP